jgi:hypothetical protein
MIFEHAPTIVPAITGLSIPFQSRFYVHLGLLHLSLVLRIVGDVTVRPEARRWRTSQSLAILLFAAMTATAACKAIR